jgi:formate dehydrogenase iron-sulfur subunit
VTITPLADPRRRHDASGERGGGGRDLHGISAEGPEGLALEPGQHYRFTFDMGACIGCHSCEVACAEQNGLPADVSWRRVGEIEGGEYPNTKRMHISMACNHCLEPACLQGCPTGAYTKLDNGIVMHHADDCIGCQYCTWNCPYSVPAFQPDRRIVTKCDMCSRRLDAGLESACVAACPTKAIGIEAIDPVAWRADPHGADAPHLPSSMITRSTTRIVLPDDLPAETVSGTSHLLRLEHPHWSLLVVTLLTQLALGLAASGLVMELADASTRGTAVMAAVAGVMALAASPLHLGRPAVAYKALRNLRSSWLSREVLCFGLFGTFAVVNAAMSLVDVPGQSVAAGVTVLAGCAGVFASGRLYKVPGRPAWNSWLTIVMFGLSALVMGGPVAVSALHAETAVRRALVVSAIAGAMLQAVVLLANTMRMRCSSQPEARASLTLMVHHRRAHLVCRVMALLVVVGTGAVTIASGSYPAIAVMSVAAMISEVLGRYLFYVTVVPLAMPGRFNGAWR